MVKQKAQKSWLQKTKSQRHAKSLTDARLLLKPCRNKTSYSEYVCSICDTKGSLLACIKCLRLFHLSCLNLSPLRIPLSQWPCVECSSDYSQSFLDSLTTSVDLQRQEKENSLKRLTKKINKAKPNTKLKDFESKHPHLVRHGQILYPIDDALLWAKPKLHQVSFIPFPPEHFLNVPPGLVTDLVFVCDFCWTFQGVLKSPSLKCEALYTILNNTHETLMSRALHISLLKPLIVVMLKTEEYRKKGPVLNYLVYKIKKIVGFENLIENSYLKFMEDLFSLELWQGLIQEIDKETWQLFQGFSFVDNYFALPADYKLRLLVVFISLLLETKLLNDECQKRQEHSMKLLKDISDYTSKLRKATSDEKTDIEVQVQGLKNELKKFPVRTLPLGSDRVFREYFFYPWDINKVFVRTPDSQSREAGSWSFLDKRSEVEALLQSLSEKGHRESVLKQDLSSLLLSQEFQSTELETTSSDTEEEKNKQRETVNILESLKNNLKDLHLLFVDSLKLQVNRKFIQDVEEAEVLTELVLNFQHYLPSEVKKHLIWEMSDLQVAWEASLKECRNPSEVFLCFHLLRLVTEKYAKENRVVLKDSSKSETRRSFRLEKLNQIKKEVQKTQDVNCYICGDFGLVACCDRCPKVAHLECLKVQELPEGEWSCPVCIEKMNNVRVTRSRQLKY